MSYFESIESKCKAIIHTFAAAAAAGNLIPAPGAGMAADTIALTSMAMALSAVFGDPISENVAKNLAIAALKETTLNQPIKLISKEVSKFIPILGQLVAPSVSATVLESAGWVMVRELREKTK